MKNNTAITGKLIYEAEIQFTGEIDFGITMNEIISGQKAIPPAGARFDQSFQGTLTGPEIIGSVEGVDYPDPASGLELPAPSAWSDHHPERGPDFDCFQGSLPPGRRQPGSPAALRGDPDHRVRGISVAQPAPALGTGDHEPRKENCFHPGFCSMIEIGLSYAYTDTLPCQSIYLEFG